MIVKIGNTDADVRVHAVMSTPRLGFMDNFACWMQSLVPLGIIPTKITGAFWGQCLQRAIEMHLDDCEWILTIDYDSFFTKADVELLFALAMTFQCDALTGFQTKRDDGRPMITLLGTQESPPENGKTSLPAEWFAQPVQQVDAIHFGCTVISAAALRRTPKPWFLDEPDKNGSWEDGRVDADMFFWRRFRQAGNRVFVTPRVSLGHGEYKITWPGANLNNPVFQNTQDFLSDSKKPEGCWRIPS